MIQNLDSILYLLVLVSDPVTWTSRTAAVGLAEQIALVFIDTARVKGRLTKLYFSFQSYFSLQVRLRIRRS